MNVITPKALALLHRVKGDNEMIYVCTKDLTGYIFSGRVITVNDQLFDVEAEDGDMVYDLPISRIMYVDIRPLKHYTGYGVVQFVNDVASASGWNR